MSTDGKLSEYLAYRGTIEKLMLVIGLWPLENTTLFYRLLPYLHILASSGMTVGIAGFVSAHFPNIGLVTRGLGVMTSFLSVILKITCFMLNRESAVEVHHILDKYIKQALNIKELQETILRDITFFRRLCWAFIFLVWIVSAIFVFLPFRAIVVQKMNQIEKVQYSLIYPGVYPWDIPGGGLIYQFHLLFECLATVSLFFATSAIDSLFSLYLFQMIAQIRIMSHHLPQQTNQESCTNVICWCVRHHDTLKKCRDIIQGIYGPIILWMMGTNAIVLCVHLFQISQMKSISIFRGVLLAAYVFLKMVQTFMYAWSGNCLTVESGKLRTAIYNMDWFGKKSVMNNVIIMLNQEPMNLTACHFSVVSINMFAAVLNTTISYFFLLQTLDQDS